MISYVRGELVSADPEQVVVESAGIGYRILIPQSVYSNLPGIGQEVKIHTYFQVREDAVQLFGFLDADDKEVFRLLLGVNGVGPKAALSVLGIMTADDLRMAVLSGDEKAIAKAPGLGKKTAQKVILELKDKMSLGETLDKFSEHAAAKTSVSAGNEKVSEAVEALAALGYSAAEALKAVRTIENRDAMSVEELLRQALVIMN